MTLVAYSNQKLKTLSTFLTNIDFIPEFQSKLHFSQREDFGEQENCRK
jgi:hypothetical protein